MFLNYSNAIYFINKSISINNILFSDVHLYYQSDESDCINFLDKLNKKSS